MLPNEHITTVGDIKGIYSVGDLTVSSGEDVQRFYLCVLFCFSVEECSFIGRLTNSPYPIVAWSDVVNLFKREVCLDALFPLSSVSPALCIVPCDIENTFTFDEFWGNFPDTLSRRFTSTFLVSQDITWWNHSFPSCLGPGLSSALQCCESYGSMVFLAVCLYVLGGGGLLFSTNLPVIVVSLETCFCQQKIKAAESSLGLEILPICRLPASKPVNSALWTGTGSAC